MFESARRDEREAARSCRNDSTERAQRKKHHRAKDREAHAEQRGTAGHLTLRAATRTPHPAHTDGQREAEDDDEHDE